LFKEEVKKMLNRKGQNTAEYAILIALIIAAAVGMQTYVKRGLQGKMKDAVNHTGTAQEVGGANLTFSGDQYEPYYAASDTNVKTMNNATRSETAHGGIVQGINNKTTVDVGGTETVSDTTNAD